MLDERFKKELFEDRICSEFIDQGKDIPVGTVVNYLTEYCPDSCFANNYKNGVVFDDYDEELYDYYRYEVLHWCGCGSPEEADKEVIKYLNLIDIPWKNESLPFSEKYSNSIILCQEYFGCKTIYDNSLLLCLAYTMYASGFFRAWKWHRWSVDY